MRIDKAYIQAKLKQSSAWRKRTLLMLWQRQTEDERTQGATLHHNSRGFGETDARRLSREARKAQMGYSLDHITLQRRLPKYWRQVLEAIAQAQPQRVAKRTKQWVELQS